MVKNRIKETRKVIWVLIILIFILFIIVGKNRNIIIRLDDQKLTLSFAAEEPLLVCLDDIYAVSEISYVDFGKKLSGKETRRYKFGIYNNTSFGDYYLCIDEHINTYIVLDTSKNLVVFNFESDDATHNFYKAFTEFLDK